MAPNNKLKSNIEEAATGFFTGNEMGNQRNPNKSTLEVEGVFGKMKFLETQISALSDVPNSVHELNHRKNDSSVSTNSPVTPKSNRVVILNDEKKVDEDDSNKRIVQKESAMIFDANASVNVSVKTSVTYGAQSELPPLPIPSLDETLNKFLQSLEALQNEDERAEARRVVLDFMKGDGPKLQELLVAYDRKGREKGEIGRWV